MLMKSEISNQENPEKIKMTFPPFLQWLLVVIPRCEASNEHNDIYFRNNCSINITLQITMH